MSINIDPEKFAEEKMCYIFSSFLLVRKALIFKGLHNINIVIMKPKTFLLKAITSYLI